MLIEGNFQGKRKTVSLDSNGQLVIGGVSGNSDIISGTFTRPNNTTTYSAYDVVSDNATTTTLVELQNVGRTEGGTGYITEIRIVANQKSISPRFRVHFFNASNPTVASDNNTHKELYADTSKRLGYWIMPAMDTAADTANSDMSRSSDLTVKMPFKCASNSTSLYVMLETLDGFTPTALCAFTIIVGIDRN